MKKIILLLLCACVASLGAQSAVPVKTTSSASVVSTVSMGMFFEAPIVHAPIMQGQQFTSFRSTEMLTGASVPAYVPASSGDLNPFDAQGVVARRNGPPTTGGSNPVNPDLKKPTPLGDALSFLFLLVGIYACLKRWTHATAYQLINCQNVNSLIN